MNKFGKWVFILGVLFVGGCIAVGRDFDQRATLQIQANKTTQSEVRGLLGEPQEKGLEGGFETWTYRYLEKVILEPDRHKELKIYFQPDGRVHTTAYTTSNSEWVIKR